MFIITFSLFVSLFSGHPAITNPSSYSFGDAYAQSPPNVTLPATNVTLPATNVTLPATNTGISQVPNGTGTTAANNNGTERFNIATIADIGCVPEGNRTVNNMASKDPELVLVAGDLSYTNSSKCFIDMMKPFGDKTKITLGNHEWPFSLMMEYVYQYNLTRPYYAFNVDNVHVLVLSNEFAFDDHSAQFDFARDDLLGASVDPEIDWILVMMHKGMYTSHFADSLTDMRNAYHPLFQQFGVDFVLQGHAHYYERTFPIEFNAESRREPIVANATIGTSGFVDPRGPIFATVGLGGFSIHDLKSGKAPFVQSQNLAYGFLDLAMQTNQTTTVLNGTYYGNDGQVHDQFKIIKPSIFALTGNVFDHRVFESKYAQYDNTDQAG